MAITPSPFMLLEATPSNGPLHFIASTDRGHVQISGRTDRWGTSELSEDQRGSSVLPGLYRTPSRAAEVLGRFYDLAPYRNADVYCRWREREARRRLAAPIVYDLAPAVATHVPLAPRGYTLSTDWSDGKYRFFASDGPARASIAGVGTHWSAAVVDIANDRKAAYGAEFVTPEEAAAAITAAGHTVGLWNRAAAQRRDYPDTIPLIDEHGDRLWVVSRESYYRMSDLETHERSRPDRTVDSPFRML